MDDCNEPGYRVSPVEMMGPSINSSWHDVHEDADSSGRIEQDQNLVIYSVVDHGHLRPLWHIQFLIHMKGSVMFRPSGHVNIMVMVLVRPGPQHFRFLHVEQYLGRYSSTLLQ